ncbi:DUF4349 domain-containing protein [Croceivirga thetidis]|uniref:DUF4349 domain-containing protein n=1 Tax=Croceivirga thetidis TaxID=2721623 RepID=A0ABX1GQA5_9FLAO|nr:DUF4349 domain-containing protein [Croceivirga thetidis]NKI32079.1 DUF4349 domain-containing protein [Croceivirga thetidis]
MKVFFFSFLTVLVATCGGGGSNADVANYETATAEVYDNTSELESTTKTVNEAQNRKLIWNGNVELKVNDVQESTTKVNQICEEFGGFVSGMNLNNTNYEISNTITIRVDSKNFNKVIESLKDEAEYIKSVSVTSNDVTEEYIDVQSRLNTKKEVRDRYIEILKNKTGKISEVLEAEEAIRKITEEIEAKEGRLRYLKDKIKFSTISVRLYETVSFSNEPEAYEKSFGDKSLQALKNGWKIITTLVLILINIWPLLLITIVLIWRWKWIKSKLRGGNKS